jgi:hypothetical protein
MLVLGKVGAVEEYTVKFDTLKHQILLGDPYTSEVLFVERYLVGLKPKIRTAVILHCLEDVETASLLAKLQESELEMDKTGGFHHQRDRDKHKSAFVDSIKGAGRTDGSAKPEIPHWDNKLEALQAYCKSKGQCFTCGEKWNKTHKWATQVPLHIVEELLEVLQTDNEDRQSSSTDSLSEDDLMLLAPLSAPSTPRQRRTMRLHGMIDKHPVLILVDSGFIGDKLAALLNSETKSTAPARFVAANGAPLTSDKKIPMLTWLCQGHSFQQDFQVLPLPCYDIILGADWLEDHRPMWVHWKQRWMKFTHKKRRIRIQGITDQPGACRLVSAAKLHESLKRGAISDCIQVQSVHQEPGVFSLTEKQVETIPVSIQALLEELKNSTSCSMSQFDCLHIASTITEFHSSQVRIQSMCAPIATHRIRKQKLSSRCRQC